jgi:hypothetical protein
MKTKKIIGISLIVLGIIAFIITGCTFSYRGNDYAKYVVIGEITFISWLPILIIGVILYKAKK